MPRNGRTARQRCRRGLAWVGALRLSGLVLFCLLFTAPHLSAQESPLDTVHTAAPPPAAPKEARPAGEAGNAKGSSGRGSAIQVNADLVLVPVTVTDPQNRLVTGLERGNFQLFDSTQPQTIKSFATEDAPLSIGIIFDLSGSMQSKFVRARKALSEFLRTCNPQDEFFVIGFNDRPAVLVDYTSDVEDVEARMVMLKPENRTALIDAIYLGVNKLKSAKYSRKALLVVSDGGDNRSRYTEGELTRAVRESEVQIYSVGIFDNYAPTAEEQNGPQLLHEISETTGGRLFQVRDVQDLTDIAQRISEELRNEYVIGYTPTDRRRNGAWRKLNVRLLPPPGLPELTVHNREGYYAPSQ